MNHARRLVLLAALLAPLAPLHAAPPTFSMEQVLSYPYPSGLVAAERGDRIAWVINARGVRNVWVAEGPAFVPRQVTAYDTDDGEEITQLTFSPDGRSLVYVRGGDHHANWPAAGDLAPDAADGTQQPKVTLWAVALPGGKPRMLTEGDAPAISARGQLAYLKDHQVWSASLDGKGKPRRLFFDRGKDDELRWSPDGRRLAFVSDRGDHAFIGLYTADDQPLAFLAPSTGRDASPRWSPDGTRIAFVRQPGKGGAPQPVLKQTPQPWSIWVADAASGKGRAVWRGPDTLLGSLPETAGEANLRWAAGDRLVFLADLDGWPHLYALPAAGGEPLLLTPGAFMVEHVAESRDRRFLVYDANTGSTPHDDDRRHLFRVPVDRAAPQALTAGETLEWQPAIAAAGRVAFIGAGAKRPPAVALIDANGGARRELVAAPLPADFPTDALVVPQAVTFTAADGTRVHGQLFRRDDGAAAKPAVVFVHGGPPRQMLLGWHYMDYYSDAYAVNQYLANHGFVVLSVNYRLGIGYGNAFHYPEHWGPTGAAEYQDVLAGARFLQRSAGVDPQRIGIWGGSYGGYLTALALARNSDVFKAGVDLHGVHDWSRFLGEWFGDPQARYEQGDREQAMKVAWQSSPDADVAHWTSPVLLIQGDDDRNVQFQQTIDLARRLQAKGVPYEELVIPNEIHGFLRHASWLRADSATAAFLAEKLRAAP
ncbi:MAG TPA: prolyl oligopeptidase family serine peptidase [Mizugakiibacter sp.]